MKYLTALVPVLPLLSVSAAAQDRVILEPASDWVMNYDDDSCALQRQFGLEGGQAFFELREFGPGDQAQVTVASHDFELQNHNYQVQFDPFDQEPNPTEGLFIVNLGDGYVGHLFLESLTGADEDYLDLMAQFFSTTPALLDEEREMLFEGRRLARLAFADEGSASRGAMRDLQRLMAQESYASALRRGKAAFERTEAFRAYVGERAGRMKGLALDEAFDRPIYLHTGSLAGAMEAMNTCLEELQAHWGIDVEAHRSLSRPVEPYDYERLVREVQDDYPQQLVSQRIPGLVRVRLDVSAEGMPTGCHLQSHLNQERYERIACNNMMRFARFYPALDAQGVAIPSFYQVTVIYHP